MHFVHNIISEYAGYTECCLFQVIRELDRERTTLERQEKKLVVDIKKMAKSGQMDAVRIMAKDLVRTRNFIKKFILMRANIQAIALKVQTLKSQAAMANAMKGGCGLKYLIDPFIWQYRCDKSLEDNEQETQHASVTENYDGV